MKCTPLLTAVAGAVLLFSSCKNQTGKGIAIPKDASVALHINGASLSSKLSWEEIKNTNWFKEMHNEAKDSLAQKILDDPENSGIDTKSPLVFFMKKQGKGGYGVFEGTLKNATAFESFLKTAVKTGEVKKEGDWSYMTSTDKGVVSWDNSKFAFIVDMPMLGMSGSFAYASMNESKFSSDSLKKFVTGVLNLENKNSLGNDERFTSMIKENGDVHIWVNTEQLYSGMVGGVLSMMKMNTLLQGNVSASALSFDEGKISMKTKQYYGKEVSDLIKKYEPKAVSSDLVNRIPSQNVVGALVMNYPPEGLKAFLTLAGFDGLLNGVLGKYNTSLNEITAACKGDLLFAATDLQMKTQTQNFGGTPYTSSKPDIKLLFGLSVNNKAAFDKLISIAQAQLQAEGGQQALSMVSFKSNNDWFAISNSGETVDNFLAGKNNGLSFADKISGHPFGFFVDIQRIMKSVQPMATEASSLSAFDASIKLWQDLVITGGEFKDGACVADFVVNLVDKKTNSLQQLNRYFEQLAALKKKEVADVNETIMPPAADSAVAGQ